MPRRILPTPTASKRRTRSRRSPRVTDEKP